MAFDITVLYVHTMGVVSKGPIALQAHDGELVLKNVKYALDAFSFDNSLDATIDQCRH